MQRINGPFDRYELTEDELFSARILDPSKQAYYQNMLSKFMEDKMELMFDAGNPLRFAQAEAELKGQVILMQLLLNDHQLAKEELLERNTAVL
mgnify:CR=1 FL=1